MKEEPLYEGIEIVVRTPDGDETWYDRIHDLITATCDGESSADECPCGMQSMGGMTGTLERVYDWQRITENWATVKTADLKLILDAVKPEAPYREAYERLRKEAYWHDEVNEWLASLPEDEEPDDLE